MGFIDTLVDALGVKYFGLIKIETETDNLIVGYISPELLTVSLVIIIEILN